MPIYEHYFVLPCNCAIRIFTFEELKHSIKKKNTNLPIIMASQFISPMKSIIVPAE